MSRCIIFNKKFTFANYETEVPENFIIEKQNETNDNCFSYIFPKLNVVVDWNKDNSVCFLFNNRTIMRLNPVENNELKLLQIFNSLHKITFENFLCCYCPVEYKILKKSL
jgi:hypothetical protein